jgi:hypothetical protein
MRVVASVLFVEFPVDCEKSVQRDGPLQLASSISSIRSRRVVSSADLGRMANLRLVDKQGKELVKLKLQVLA